MILSCFLVLRELLVFLANLSCMHYSFSCQWYTKRNELYHASGFERSTRFRQSNIRCYFICSIFRPWCRRDKVRSQRTYWTFVSVIKLGSRRIKAWLRFETLKVIRKWDRTKKKMMMMGMDDCRRIQYPKEAGPTNDFNVLDTNRRLGHGRLYRTTTDNQKMNIM